MSALLKPDITDAISSGHTVTVRDIFPQWACTLMVREAGAHVTRGAIGPDQELWPVDMRKDPMPNYRWEEGLYHSHFAEWHGLPFALFAGSGLVPIFREVFGGAFSIMVDSSRFRYIDPRHPKWAFPWHQDAATADYGGKRVFTCWVPLQGVGEGYPDRPGLAYYDRTEDVLWPCDPSMGKPWAMDKNNPMNIKARASVANLEPGDCVIFDSLTPHATYMPPEAIVPRMSLDFRVHAYGDGPPFALGKPVWTCGQERRAMPAPFVPGW